MKKVSSRARLMLVLAGAVVLGLVVFLVRYAVHAQEWVVFPGSPHVYAGGNLATGRVVDRNGTVLLQNTEQGRVYTQDEALRTASLHLLGDREGYVQSGVLNAYTQEMIGYSKLRGLYHLSQSGNTLALTLDAEVQKAAYAALGDHRGVVGVYNYKTGEILCMVSAPAYDPAARPEIDETDPAWSGVYVNRFLGSAYVPGSIFKLVTLCAALETIPEAEDLVFTCAGSLNIQGDDITCHSVHGTLSLAQALAGSCNSAFGELSARMGAQTLQAMAEAFGISGSLTVDGVETAPGHFDLSQAALSQVAWAGIGQYTDTVNPCQYLTVLGAIAGGGRAARPYVVSSVKTALGKGVYRAEPTLLDPVISPETAQTAADYMQAAVETVYGADNFGGLTVCAKSGTAEVGGGEAANAMFVGFVRDESCPVAFFIAVENGGSGAAVCVPIASRVLAACQQALG